MGILVVILLIISLTLAILLIKTDRRYLKAKHEAGALKDLAKKWEPIRQRETIQSQQALTKQVKQIVKETKDGLTAGDTPKRVRKSKKTKKVKGVSK